MEYGGEMKKNIDKSIHLPAKRVRKRLRYLLPVGTIP